MYFALLIVHIPLFYFSWLCLNRVVIKLLYHNHSSQIPHIIWMIKWTVITFIEYHSFCICLLTGIDILLNTNSDVNVVRFLNKFLILTLWFLVDYGYIHSVMLWSVQKYIYAHRYRGAVWHTEFWIGYKKLHDLDHKIKQILRTWPGKVLCSHIKEKLYLRLVCDNNTNVFTQ